MTKLHSSLPLQPYEHIVNRNFNQLRSLHEQYFRRPGNYGVVRLVPVAADGDANAAPAAAAAAQN